MRDVSKSRLRYKGMTALTIKVFLANGNANGLRIAELSNWSGKVVAAPRAELAQLVDRDELGKPGLYLLLGQDPDTGKSLSYIGEAEVLRDRLRQHRTKDFWSQAIAIVSKDENLTKAHIRFLEGRLIELAKEIGRVEVLNSKASGAVLPESDLAEMEVFLSNIRHLLPVLGSNLVSPLFESQVQGAEEEPKLECKIRDLRGFGRRAPAGFVVLAGSQAVLEERQSAVKKHPFVVKRRAELLESGALVPDGGNLRFTRDVEFSSPSAAAGVIQGGGANGLYEWRTADGTKLKDLD
jgi:hypothetical protein